jgi:hypothetical protein
MRVALAFLLLLAAGAPAEYWAPALMLWKLLDEVSELKPDDEEKNPKH